MRTFVLTLAQVLSDIQQQPYKTTTIHNSAITVYNI